MSWLDSLASDAVFGWRQLRKRPVVSAAAILSLAVAIGATTAAFRLVRAVLLRPLPVAHPERLFALATAYVDSFGRPNTMDDFDYPSFVAYRDAVADRADLLVAGAVSVRQSVVFGNGAQPEKPYRQYVSGNLFPIFGLRPALGRLFTPEDDRAPGASPVAVVSYEYWTRRFGRDPRAVGSTFRMGADTFAIVGVAPKGFTGTEPGYLTDIFLPAMMNVEAINNAGWSWFRILVRPKNGFSPEQVRQPIEALYARGLERDARNLPPDTARAAVTAYLHRQLVLESAAAGASALQKDYRRPLAILAVLVVLVLLVACANVGNLMAAQAAARAREMALRVSIGAGQWRLMQLVLVESLLLAALASALGTVFASWSAPIVVAMLHMPQDPVRLVLDTGWDDVAFAAAMASAVALVFGLAPALRASRVKPMSALRGGEETRSRRRLMNALVAAQMAFCILVQFVAGLFVSTFQRLSNRPLGFEAQHLLVMDAVTGREQPLAVWMQVADKLRETPGVRSIGLAWFPPLERDRWTVDIRLPGHAVEPNQPFGMEISPGYFDALRIGWIAGRDFRLDDRPPRLGPDKQPLAGAGIVNQTFAREYFNGRNPVGRVVYMLQENGAAAPVEIVGYVRDAVYRDMRETMHATLYVPEMARNYNTFMIRTAGDPLPMVAVMRRALERIRPDFEVHMNHPESEFVQWQTLRERLLAALSLFFAMAALLLAAIGLYGVLHYAVTRQRREIGIRMALGARPWQVVRSCGRGVAGTLVIGLATGLAGGIVCGRFAESLLFEVKATDAMSLAKPLAALLAVALVAALPPAARAARIDPAETLRGE